MKPTPHTVAGPRRWLAHPWLSGVILATWLLLQDSVAPVHWLWGALLGVLLPWLAHDFVELPVTRLRRARLMLRLVALVLWDILRANLTVARVVLDFRRAPEPAWLRVPHTLDDARAVVMLASIISLTPGTVSCVIDEDRREILVHALDAPEPRAVVAEIVQRYEHALKEIFG